MRYILAAQAVGLAAEAWPLRCPSILWGGVDADGTSGEGTGLLVPLPSAFLIREACRLNSSFNPDWKIALGVFFLPRGGVSAPEDRKEGAQGLAPLRSAAGI